MKWTALLAAAAFLLAVGSATAAPKAMKGTVVAKHVRNGTVVLAGPKGLGLAVHVAPRRVRLGDRVSVVGKRLRVLAHVTRTRIRAVVVKRLPHALRVATGRSVLTIHTNRRALASRDNGDLRAGTIGEFEIEIENEGLFEDGFTAVSQREEIEAKGTVASSTSSQVTIDAGDAMLTFAAPAGVTLPVIATGTFVEARGVTIDGVLTLQRLRTEDEDRGDDRGHDGSGGHGAGPGRP